jgi:hypothetical protein
MQRRRRSWSPSFSDVLQPPCIVYIYTHTKRVISQARSRMSMYILMQCNAV